jgi:hypothetical protein
MVKLSVLLQLFFIHTIRRPSEAKHTKAYASTIMPVFYSLLGGSPPPHTPSGAGPWNCWPLYGTCDFERANINV